MDQLEKCKLHQDKKIQFLCLNQTCNKQSKGCVFCIKDTHELCDEKFIINIDQIQDKISIKKTEDISNIEKEISQRIENEFDKFFEHLEKEKEYILEGFQSPNNNINNLTVGEVQKYKQFFDISQNQKNKKVIIQSKINPKQENIEEDIELFQAKLQNKMEVGSRLIEGLTFYNTQPLQKDLFEFVNCEAEKQYNGLKVILEQKQHQGFLYTRKPAKNFRLKILSKRRENVYFLLVNQRTLKKIKKQSIMTSDKESCGVLYSQMNMDGIYQRNYDFEQTYDFKVNLDSNDIFKNQNVKDNFLDCNIYYEYSKNDQSFKIFSRDKTVDLKQSKNLDGKYYLVIGLNIKDQEILIESYNL